MPLRLVELSEKRSGSTQIGASSIRQRRQDRAVANAARQLASSRGCSKFAKIPKMDMTNPR